MMIGWKDVKAPISDDAIRSLLTSNAAMAKDLDSLKSQVAELSKKVVILEKREKGKEKEKDIPAPHREPKKYQGNKRNRPE